MYGETFYHRHKALTTAAFVAFCCIYAEKKDVAGDSNSVSPNEIFQILIELLRF